MAKNSLLRSGTFGLEGLLDVLKGLPEDLRAEILAPAVAAGARPIRDAARQAAPVRSGALRDSIDVVVRKRPRSGSAVAVVGPAKGYFRAGQRLKKGESVRGADSPHKYAHLIEFGHVTVARRKGTSRREGTATELGFVPPKPFLRPAVQGQSEAAANAIRDSIMRGLDRSLNRHRKKGTLVSGRFA